MIVDYYLVTVILLSHNHLPFIRQAVNSVIDQNIDFPIKLIVLDDGSTDGTAELLLSEFSENPMIELHFSERNQGPGQNGKRLTTMKLGKYVAFLDGDDAWTYEQKLQQQVAFLELNPEYVGAFHDAYIKAPANQVELQSAKSGFKTYSQMHHYAKNYFLEDALNRVIIPNSSVVYRTSCYDRAQIRSLAQFKLSGGWMQSVVVLKHGMMKYFNEPWSVYHDHGSGITKTTDSTVFNQNNIGFYLELLKDPFYSQFKRVIFNNVAREYAYMLLADKGTLARSPLIAKYIKYSLKQIWADASFFLKTPHRNV
jgi:glycosyltransferase involved in cell wall biosynthesis